MHRFISRPLMLAAAVVAGIGPTLTVGAGPAHAINECDFEFTFSRPTVLPMAAQITGDGWAACADASPDMHHLTLALEYQSGAGWEVASQKTDDRIPARYPNRTTYTVSTACYAGNWRVVVAIRGAIQGHMFTYDRASDTATVPSAACPQRF